MLNCASCGRPLRFVGGSHPNIVITRSIAHCECGAVNAIPDGHYNFATNIFTAFKNLTLEDAAQARELIKANRGGEISASDFEKALNAASPELAKIVELARKNRVTATILAIFLWLIVQKVEIQATVDINELWDQATRSQPNASTTHSYSPEVPAPPPPPVRQAPEIGGPSRQVRRRKELILNKHLRPKRV